MNNLKYNEILSSNENHCKLKRTEISECFLSLQGWEYWSGLSFPTLGDLPDTGSEPKSLASPALAGRFFTICPCFPEEFIFVLDGILPLAEKTWHIPRTPGVNTLCPTTTLTCLGLICEDCPFCLVPSKIKQRRKARERQHTRKWICSPGWGS